MGLILNDISDFIIDCEHKTAPIQESGIPSIRTPNIGKGSLILEGVNRVSEEVYKDWTQRGEPEEGDLIIAREAPVGNVAIIPKGLKVCLGQRTVLVRPDRTWVDPKYLCFLLLGDELQGQILTKTTGATVSHLNMKDIRELKLPQLPPLHIQRTIASILSAYDDLIENNKRRIKLLEQIAEEIYKEWFVRMRFPGYETAKVVDGLPEGWEKVNAENIYNVNIGKTPPREQSHWFTNDGTGIKWVSIRDINNSSVFVMETSEGIISVGVSKFNINIAPKDTVIVSFKLTVGKVAITFEDMVTNEAIAHFNIRDSNLMNREYTYCYLNHFQYGELGNTSSIGNAVNSKIVKKMPVITPNREITSMFGEIISPILEEINILIRKNFILRQTRDLLLPRLISGKLSVEHLVKQAEEGMAMAAEPGGEYR